MDLVLALWVKNVIKIQKTARARKTAKAKRPMTKSERAMPNNHASNLEAYLRYACLCRVRTCCFCDLTRRYVHQNFAESCFNPTRAARLSRILCKNMRTLCADLHSFFQYAWASQMSRICAVELTLVFQLTWAGVKIGRCYMVQHLVVWAHIISATSLKD